MPQVRISVQPYKAFLMHQHLVEDIPRVVVDLGHSADGETCGLTFTGAPEAEEYTFGETIRRVGELMRVHSRFCAPFFWLV